ncbi:MAG: ornithine cyclodeaminase [Microbacterium sp.]
MVDLTDVGGIRRWLADRGVAQAITGLVDYLDADFRRWPSFEKIARIASHSREGVIELMPASDGHQYAFKYVNGHPGNPRNGYQTVTAFGVLSDVATGYPVFVSEMTVLTALRTAATSALAARALARPDSTTMGMIGAGSQAEFQATAFHRILGIDRIRVWDTDPGALRKFVTNLSDSGIEITVASDAADAVAGMDIVTTCTADKTNATILERGMIEPGMHLNAIGGDCPGKTELDAGILTDAAARVFVEFAPQTRIEGEIQQLPGDFPVTELWEVLLGHAPGRTGDRDVTVFDSVGFAVEDYSALRYLHDQVRGSVYSQFLDLVASPDDPKDLWSLVGAGSPAPVGV